MITLPARQASLAKLRLRKIRTAQSHLSRRLADSAGEELNPAKKKRPHVLSNVRPRAADVSVRRNQFRRTRGNSARSQSSSIAFSCRTESSRKAIVIFIMKARSRRSRFPSLTTFPSASVNRKLNTSRGG